MPLFTPSTKIYHFLLLAFVLHLGTLALIAQAGTVIGITGEHLVQVNVENGGLTPLQKLQGLPAGAELRNLVYIVKDKAFYATMEADSNPSLVKVRPTGECELIGEFSLSGQNPFFCEALTYDRNKDQLLVAVSLDGDRPADRKSEAILIVDRSSAECRLGATIRQLPAPDEFDEMAVFEGQLFGLDWVADRETTYVHPFNLQYLDGRELFAGTKQNIPYFAIDDVVVVGHLLYFADHRSMKWYFFDLRGRHWFEQGKVHGPARLGPIRLTGLAYLPLAQA